MSAVCISVAESRGALSWLNEDVIPALGEAAGDACLNECVAKGKHTCIFYFYLVLTSDPARELVLEPCPAENLFISFCMTYNRINNQ